MPVTFLTVKDGDMISKSILDISKRLGELDSVIDNITQQYHQFAIVYDKVRPLFETLTTDIETVNDLRRDLEFYKSEDYILKILQNYEIDLEGQTKIKKKKKSTLITRKKE